VTVAAPAPATDADLALVHDEPYITAVEAVGRWAEPRSDASGGLEGKQLRVAHMFGLGTEDNPVFPGMHEASALVAGATLAAARAAWSGSAEHGRASRRHASCHGCSRQRVRRLQRPGDRDRLAAQAGAERVAYVDIDAHHGDGVQAAFYADPRVLTISLHEHLATLFPFTGLPAETGGPGAEGSAVNVALPARTGMPAGFAHSTR
jgi:acetoin utilization protein AcuC